MPVRHTIPLGIVIFLVLGYHQQRHRANQKYAILWCTNRHTYLRLKNENRKINDT